MPITGLLDCGLTMFRGTIMICSSSAFAATDWGTCLRCVEGEARGRRWRARDATDATHCALDAVRMASKSKKKPPTTSSDGHDARRWRKVQRTLRQHRFISSPSKSALYGDVTDKFNRKVL